MLPMGIPKRAEAGGNAAINHGATLKPAFQHGTGATVPFPATDLGARKVPGIPDKIQQACARRQAGFHQAIIQDKFYHTRLAKGFSSVIKECVAKNTT
jgi:hypothetical protein